MTGRFELCSSILSTWRTRRRARWMLVLVAWATTLASQAAAGGGPESVFLVVNPRGPGSLQVANHYIALRKIPPQNIFYLPLPGQRKANSIDFREKVLRPILAEINKRGLHDQIDQIVYSAQFPYQIDFTDSFPDPKPKEINVYRPFASITGATFLYQFIEESSDQFSQLNTNFYLAPQVGDKTTSRAFHRRIQWSPPRVAVASGGLNYLLATSLGIIDDEGNTADEIVAYLKRAAEADGTRPSGVFYYMKNADPRSTTRDEGFAAAVAEIRALGLRAEIGSGVAPNSKDPLNGLTTGSATVALRASGSTLAPGALVDNFTSFGAVMARFKGTNPQTRISEYLRLGAAGASGTVTEPYAIKEKFPAPSLQVHYARGCCMAESFYQSVQGPFQLLIVGDPLCQPWARVPVVSVDGIAEGQMLSDTVTLTPSAKTAAGQKIAHFQLFVDGNAREKCAPGEKLQLDTKKLPDGYHELRVVAVDDSPIEVEGRAVIGATVKNGRDAVSLSSPSGARITTPQVNLTITSTVDGVTAVWQNGREVGRANGRSATLQIPVEKLGKGPVVLIASTLGSVSIRSQPLRLDIQ